MKNYAFSKIKQKKYKTLTFKLLAITEAQKQALLTEYFNMCKMVYRIRSMVAENEDRGEEVLRYDDTSDAKTMIKISYQVT